MLSSMLSSDQAIEVPSDDPTHLCRLWQLLATHEDLALRLDPLEWRRDEQEGQSRLCSQPCNS
jgi:hypothetical protein